MIFLIDNLHIDYLTRRGDLQAAFEKVDKLLSALKDDNKEVAIRVRLLLLKVWLLTAPVRMLTDFMQLLKEGGDEYQEQVKELEELLKADA